MSEESKSTGNKIVRCVCNAETTDIIISPFIILVAIVSYLVFSIYYMIIVRRIDLEYGLPWHMPLAVYTLVTIGILLPMIVYFFILYRNVQHSNREKGLREMIIGYFAARTDAVDDADLRELKRIDNEILSTEHPISPKRTVYLLAIPAALILISLFIDNVNTQLGEFVMIAMIEMFAIGLIVTPTATSFPHEHETDFIGFYTVAKKCASDLGIEIPEFEKTTHIYDYRKLCMITVCTLGLGSIFWGYLLFRDMNLHILSHRIVENRFVEGMWVVETGHTIQDSPLKHIPAKKKLPFIGSR